MLVKDDDWSISDRNSLDPDPSPIKALRLLHLPVYNRLYQACIIAMLKMRIVKVYFLLQWLPSTLVKSCRQYSQYFAHNVLLFCLSQDRSKVLPTREHKGLLWSPFVFGLLVTTQHGPPHQCSEIAKFHASNAYSFHILWQKIGPLCRILMTKARMWWLPNCFKLLFFGIFALVTFMAIKKWSFLFKYPSESENHAAPVTESEIGKWFQQCLAGTVAHRGLGGRLYSKKGDGGIWSWVGVLVEWNSGRIFTSLTGVGCGVRGVAGWQDVITDGCTAGGKPAYIISSSWNGSHHSVTS